MAASSTLSFEEIKAKAVELFGGLEKGPNELLVKSGEAEDAVRLNRPLSNEAWVLALAKHALTVKEGRPLGVLVERDDELAPVMLPLPLLTEPYSPDAVKTYAKLFEDVLLEHYEVPKKHNREKRWRWADKLVYTTNQSASLVAGKIIYTHLSLKIGKLRWLLEKFEEVKLKAVRDDRLPSSFSNSFDYGMLESWVLCGSQYLHRGIRGTLDYWFCEPAEALADVKRTHPLATADQKKLLKSIPPEILCSDPLTASKLCEPKWKEKTLAVAPVSGLPEAGEGLIDRPMEEEAPLATIPQGCIGLREVRSAVKVGGEVRVFRTVRDIPQLVLLMNAGESMDSLVSKWMFTTIPRPATVAWVAQLLMEVYLPGLVFLTPNVSYVLDIGTCTWIGADADGGALESRISWALNYLAGDIAHIGDAWKPPISDKEQAKAFKAFMASWYTFARKIDDDIRGVTQKVLHQIMYYVKEASMGSLSSMEGRFNARSYTLPFRNGNFDLVTGQFSARKNTDCMVGVVPIYYRGLEDGENPTVKYPEMSSYLWEFSCRREEVFRDILKALYMCFFPENKHKYCIFWYGPGDTSKSTIIRILKLALGGSDSELISQLPSGMFNITNDSSSTHAGTKTELKQSHRILWADETSRNARWDAGLIKSAVNGEQEFLIRPCGSSKIRKLKFSALLNVFTNTSSLPVIVNAIGDDAIANRVRGIKCECRYVERAEYESIPEDERDSYAIKDDDRRDMLFQKCHDLVMLALLLGGHYYRESRQKGEEPLGPDAELLRRLVNTDAAAEAADSFKEWFLSRHMHAGPPPYPAGTPLVNLAALKREPEVAVRFREELKQHRTTEALWRSMDIRDENGKAYVMGRVVGGLRCKGETYVPFVRRPSEERPGVIQRAASSVMALFTSDGEEVSQRPHMRPLED